MSPSGKDPDSGEREDLLGAFVAGAARILAPNSLQFDNNEFERSPAAAKQAALEACKLVQPGDLIFITTRGFLYSVGRYLCKNDYDHVVIVLNDGDVLHVGPPSARRIRLERLLLPQRQPVVLRVLMTPEERTKFVRCAEHLVGAQYDVKRVYQFMLRLSLQQHLRRMPLQKLPLDVRSHEWICTDAAMVLLAGCSDQFRRALTKSKEELVELDIFKQGSASFSDFMRIREVAPHTLARVPLPVMKYTSNPHKRHWKAYAVEFMEMISRIKSGKLRWHLLEETVLPRVRTAAKSFENPQAWTPERKLRVFAYVVVLLIVLKRSVVVSKILVRASQLLVLRYLIQQLLLHVDLQDVARTMLAKL